VFGASNLASAMIQLWSSSKPQTCASAAQHIHKF